MKIVVVDGATLNPGDLSWSELETLGDCEVYAATAPEDVSERCGDAEIVITNKAVFDSDLIASLPQLKYIGVTATGHNVIDSEAARARDIPVTNVPTYGTTSVAQMVLAHVLEFAHNIGHHSKTVHEGRWSACPDFCYWDYPLVELAELTMGIIGYGSIGRSSGHRRRGAEAF